MSFILDGKPGASDETRQRVLGIAEEIGYRPDSAARLLAPTDLLARQHAHTLQRLLEPLGHDVTLLTGSLTAAQRTEVSPPEDSARDATGLTRSSLVGLD